jgi:hypothetical protein
MLREMEPTLNSLKDIEDALEIWSKYWPILKSDEAAIELETRIKAKVEYRKHILGSKHPKNVSFDRQTLEFKK